MKTHFGAIVFASVLAGAIEGWVRRSTTPVFVPFTALLYAAFFVLLAFLFVLLGKLVRQEKLAHVGCSLVLAAVVANSVNAIRGPKLAPLLGCLALGAIWYLVHPYLRKFFGWPLRAHVAVFALLIVAFFACRLVSAHQEKKELAGLPAAQPTAPNVVLIVSDTTRADHFGVYGYNRPTTPHLDAFSKEGVLFENAVAAAPWTLPSHASMLTGRYPHSHGAVDDSHHYDGRFITLGQYMERHGYRTAAFTGNTFLFTRRVGLGRGFAHFADEATTTEAMAGNTQLYTNIRNLLLMANKPTDLLGRRSAADINNEALDWIHGTSSPHPFFVVLNYLDVHDPYMPPEPQRKMFARPGAHPKYISISDNHFPQMSQADWRDIIDLYDGGLNVVDGQVHRLLSDLDHAGLMKNTIVIFTADHGESFGEHGVEIHGSSLYKQQTHVPLMIVWPGHVPAGKTVDQPVSTASLAATIAQLATGQSDPSFKVPDLEPLWASSTPLASWPAPRSEVVPIALDHFRNHDAPLRSITTENWYCVAGAGRIEVFDRNDQPVGVNAYRNDPVLRSFLSMDRLDKEPEDMTHVAAAQAATATKR